MTRTHQKKPTATSFARGLLQRNCACGNHAIAGECEAYTKKRLGLQAKLKVNMPGDIYEQEAAPKGGQATFSRPFKPTSPSKEISGLVAEETTGSRQSG